MAVLQDININVHGQPSEKRLQTFLRLSQNENGRMINFRVLGAPLPSNCTATFSGTKPDGNVYSKTGTVTGNFVVIEEDIQMTAVAGVWDAKLDIINGTHNIMTALIRVVVDADVVDPDAIASDSQLQGLVAEAKYYAEHARTDAYGSPLTAPTKAQMTDHTRVYVYTGSEPNMVAGNWYLWNGSAWVSGGVYNAVAVQTDTTLSVAGKAADGKAAGDAVASLKEDLNAMRSYPVLSWDIGKNIYADGSLQNNQYMALTKPIPVDSGDVIVRTAQEKDTNNTALIFYVNTYNQTTWIDRATLSYGQSYTIPNNITAVRIGFGHVTGSGVTMTQEDVDTYFSADFYTWSLVAKQRTTVLGTSFASNTKIGVYNFGGHGMAPYKDMTDAPSETFGGGCMIVLPAGSNAVNRLQIIYDLVNLKAYRRYLSYNNSTESYTVGDWAGFDFGGAEISSLKEELNAINVAPGWTWTYGKKIDASGNIFNSTASAMSGKIEVEPGDFIKRFGVTTDQSTFTLMVDVNTYSDGVWQARYALYEQGDTLTIGAGINSIVVTFSRTNESGVVMTEADINAYFNVAVYRQGALGIDLDKLSKKCDSGLTSSSDNDLVCLSVNAYNPDAPGVQVGYGYSGETNNIVQASGYIISDYIPIKQTDYLRFMVDGYDCLSERPHGSSLYSRKIAVFDENKNWIFTRNIANNPYDTPVVNLGVDGYLRVQIGEYDKASVFVSSITKQKYVDVIIFMGQSNMAGRGVTNESHTETAPVIINGAGYEFKSITDPTKLVPMEEPFGKNENVSGSIDDSNKKTGGPVVAFTNAYFTHNGGYPVVGVSASEGGTTISQWQPETNRLSDALSRLSTAITWLNSNGYRIRHKYMAWCQGESDGDSGTTKATYKSSFFSMFDAMKSAGIEKCFLFRIGEYNGSGSTDYSDIIAAQTEICQDDPDIIMITANQASYKERGMMKDSFHYYQDGYNEMGTFGGVNAALYATRGKEPTMYDPKYDNLYYSHIN